MANLDPTGSASQETRLPEGSGIFNLETTGTHCIAELYECPSDLLNDENRVKEALRGAVSEGMATLLHEVSHSFHPQGVTALGLIAESHVAIHTWPEFGYAAVDVFTCGERASAERACLFLVEALQAGRHSMVKLSRGTDLNPANENASPIVGGAAVASI